jgi:streptogramin lyase
VTGRQVVQVDAASGEIRRVVDVGKDPLLLALAGGWLWTLNSGDGNLSRIDPATGIAEVVSLEGEPPAAIGSSGEDLWVAADGHDLVRLDGATGEEEVRLSLASERLFRLRDAGFLAIAEGAIWLTIPVLGIGSAPQHLWRVDPTTGVVSAKIPIDRDPLTPVAFGGAIFVVSLPGNVLRVDPATNTTSTAAVGDVSACLVGAEGSLWVGHDFSRDVWRLDPVTLRQEARIVIGEPVRGIAYGAGRVWATTEASLVAIDPATNAIALKVRLLEKQQRDFGPIGVVVFGDSVWMSVE